MSVPMNEPAGALELGVAVPAIAEATFARAVSSAAALRTAVRDAGIDPGTSPVEVEDRQAFVDSVRHALYGSKIAAYAQGFDEIATASADNGWDVDLGAMARIWRARVGLTTVPMAAASAPWGACRRWKAPTRPGETAPVGSTRTQPRPSIQTSAQAWASLWRTVQ